MLKLLVVEDHALVREGLVRLLAQVEPRTEVKECGDFESALDILDEEGEFDLLLLDLALPGIDGFVGLDILRRRYPAMPVAVVSAFDDVPTITRVMNLGASGFIPKAFSGERPLGQPSARLDDETPLPPSTGTVHPRDVGLTERQTQVLALIVKGLSNRDIAEQLDLSEGTVKIHATAVFKTLGVSSRTQAMVAVARYGIDFERVF